MKNVDLPEIHLIYPLISENSSSKNLQRLTDLMSNKKGIDSALKSSLKNEDTKKVPLNERDIKNLLKVYNTVVTDGRYISDFLNDPSGVAKKLDVSLSDRTARALQAAAKSKAIKP